MKTLGVIAMAVVLAATSPVETSVMWGSLAVLAWMLGRLQGEDAADMLVEEPSE